MRVCFSLRVCVVETRGAPGQARAQEARRLRIAREPIALTLEHAWFWAKQRRHRGFPGDHSAQY